MKRLWVPLLIALLLPVSGAVRAADLPGEPSTATVDRSNPYGVPAGGTSGGRWIDTADHLAPDPSMAPAPLYAAPAVPPTPATGGAVTGNTVTLPGGRVVSAERAAVAAPTQPVPYNAGWANDNGARREFARRTGYPGGRPGYVIDYLVPLRDGGSKSPDNMRWVPIEDAGAAR